MRDFDGTPTDIRVVIVGIPVVVNVQVAVLIEVGIQDIAVIRGAKQLYPPAN